MAHVSKHKLAEAHQQKLVDQFAKVVGRLNQKQTSLFIEEFFGVTEKEMLTKRLAAILLIHEERSLYSIARLLQMSDTTIGTLADRYERGEYNNMISALQFTKIGYQDFLGLVDSLPTVGGIMPHRNYVMKKKYKK